jgi:hypothetical protein
MQKLILSLLFSLFAYTILAQTAEKELEKGIEAYNAFDEYVKGFASPGDMDANAILNRTSVIGAPLCLASKASSKPLMTS